MTHAAITAAYVRLLRFFLAYKALFQRIRQPALFVAQVDEIDQMLDDLRVIVNMAQMAAGPSTGSTSSPVEGVEPGAETPQTKHRST
jgi:hypothetical protein